MAQIKKHKDMFRVAVPGEAGDHPPMKNDHGERFITKKRPNEIDHMETKWKNPHAGKNVNGKKTPQSLGKRPTNTKQKMK
jgi:hypothetical protein